MTDFEGVVPALGQALSARGYSVLTPVQEAVLAAEIENSDLLVSAQTGSGKTVAFGMAIAPSLLEGADRFARTKHPLALVVAPTRELALQVRGELEWLFAKAGGSVVSCVGGMDVRAERRALERGAHIVVGTPGRLCDHIRRNSLNMSELKAVVLDEADEMLDLGFREELEAILDAAPDERRTLMFSATVPRSIAGLAKRYQRDAIRISTAQEKEQHMDIEYRALVVGHNDRENAIINVLRFFEAKNALVFCATRATVNHLTSRFANRGFSVVALSGELSQNERSHALQAMRDGRARVCIATDVAARGIDLPNLELVIHADIPKNAEGLLHRSGRTGRAGRKGVSALIVPQNSRKRTERLLQNANIQAVWAKPPSVDDILQRDNERILADPSLNEPLSDDEKEFAATLLTSHSPEQIAAAFARQFRAGRSAPEELQDIAPVQTAHKGKPVSQPSRQTGDFEGGVWFSLSVGRKHSAEPRWLVPMLCRAGEITKRDIGAINIHPAETHVELAPRCVESFIEAIGAIGKIEKTINVVRLEGRPQMTDEDQTLSHTTNKKRKSRKPRHSMKPAARGNFKQKRDVTSGEGKPGEWKKAESGHGKPRKPKYSKPGERSENPGKPAGKPKKNKKPRKK